ncbi:hypothetical protein HDV57DRAFT_54584 [Trichoderma longibrachiatum]
MDGYSVVCQSVWPVSDIHRRDSSDSTGADGEEEGHDSCLPGRLIQKLCGRKQAALLCSTCKPLRTEAPVMQSRYKYRQIAMPQLGMASLFPYRYHTIIGLHPPGPHYPKWHQDNRTRSLMWQSNSILGHSTMCDNTGASCGRMEQDCEMVDDEVLVVGTACTRISAEEPDGDSMANSAGEDASTANISESMVSGFETRESEIKKNWLRLSKGFGWQRREFGMIASSTLTRRACSESVQANERPKAEELLPGAPPTGENLKCGCFQLGDT